MPEPDHLTHLRLAISLATDKMLDGCGGPFGAVVIANGDVVGRGWNQVTSANDPTAHAEVVAIRDAAATLGGFDLSGHTLYASGEPCVMCVAAAHWAHIDAIYYAAPATAAADAGFDDSYVAEQLALPPAQRGMPMRLILLEESSKPFEAWALKADKKLY